jgi:hypothetical protein
MKHVCLDVHQYLEVIEPGNDDEYNFFLDLR